MHNFSDEYKELLTKKCRMETKLTDINKRLCTLEQIASLIDKGSSRITMLLKMNYEMDLLTATEREKSITFGEAMSSIEGIPISKETKAELEKWKKEEITFFDAFTSVLKRYSFLTEEQLDFLKRTINWEFAYVILEELIDEELSGEELIREFKKRQAMISPAVEEMLHQACEVANEDGELFDCNEINKQLKE